MEVSLATKSVCSTKASSTSTNKRKALSGDGKIRTDPVIDAEGGRKGKRKANKQVHEYYD